ncbi:MAG: diguanylate cyclase [Marinobacter sp.]|uniref:sensor domain-containing diguanylate cyclase n=1 Tax=Marinobacter sp. TaxID=50741 RepID=UPI00299E0217|nr:diguanylate cyclase [Marinobacter sp.]MDX1756313.1 diguanylate cyclase [Marinobacter sp.]
MAISTRLNRKLFVYGWPVAVTFVLGMLLTVYLTQRISDAEHRLAQSRFAQVAQHRIQLVDAMLYRQLWEVDALRRFLTLEPELDRRRFQTLVRLPERIRMAAAWVENVPRSSLDDFLARMTEEYGPSYRLQPPPDAPGSADPVLRLYPVSYLKASPEHRDLTGLDVGRLPGHPAAFDQALASGQTVLLPLEPEASRPAASLVLIAPVFRYGTGTKVIDRHFGNLRGFIYFQLDLASLLQSVAIWPKGRLETPADSDHSVRMLMTAITNDGTTSRPLYSPPDFEQLPGLNYSLELTLADRLFRLTTYPEHPQRWHDRSVPMMMFAGGTLGATLIAGYLALLLFQRHRSELRVSRHTRELEEANAYRASLLASAVDVAVIATDRDGVITLFSTGAERLLGYRSDEVVGHKTPMDFHDPDDLRHWQHTLASRLQHPVAQQEVYTAAIEAGLQRSQHWIYRHRNGEQRQVQLTLATIRDDNDEALGQLSVGVDITDYIEAMEALQRSDHLLHDLSAEVPGVIFQFLLRADETSCFTFISESVLKLFEVTADEAKNNVRALFCRLHPDDKEQVYADIRRSQQHLTPWVSEFRVQLPQQGIRWLRGESPPRRLSDGATVWNGYISDITALKDLEFKLREQATIDPLTQTFNRRHLSNQWPQAMARYRRTGVPLSMIMLDIDHFKRVNDHYGHDAGDEVLIRLSHLLTRAVRNTDTVYRLGGEEFVVMCEDTPLSGANTLARSLSEKVRNSPMPFVEQITASFGVTEVRPNETLDAAFKRLDNLLYRAKRSGRDRVVSSQNGAQLATRDDPGR